MGSNPVQAWIFFKASLPVHSQSQAMMHAYNNNESKAPVSQLVNADDT